MLPRVVECYQFLDVVDGMSEFKMSKLDLKMESTFHHIVAL